MFRSVPQNPSRVNWAGTPDFRVPSQIPSVPTGGGGLISSVFVAHIPVTIPVGYHAVTGRVSTVTHLSSGQGISQATAGFRLNF